jgi:hypothetical protein
LIPLWHFLNQTFIPSVTQSELSPESRRTNLGNGRKGFMMDANMIVDFLGEFSSDRKFPRVFISNEAGEYAPFDLVINLLEKSLKQHWSLFFHLFFLQIAYRVLNATACFFIPSHDDGEHQSNSFLEQLSEFIDQPMSTIASKIGEKFLNEIRPSQPDNLFHFIYFNPDSLSLRKSFQSSIICAQGTESQILPSSIHR